MEANVIDKKIGNIYKMDRMTNMYFMEKIIITRKWDIRDNANGQIGTYKILRELFKL